MCAELGQTVVMVTHDHNAAATTNRTIHLRDGHVVGDGPVHHAAGAHAAGTRPRTGRTSGTEAR